MRQSLWQKLRNCFCEDKLNQNIYFTTPKLLGTQNKNLLELLCSNMINKDLKYWIGFSFIPGIGRVRLGQLENYFGSLEAAWKAPPQN